MYIQYWKNISMKIATNISTGDHERMWRQKVHGFSMGSENYYLIGNLIMKNKGVPLNTFKSGPTLISVFNHSISIFALSVVKVKNTKRF